MRGWSIGSRGGSGRCLREWRRCGGGENAAVAVDDAVAGEGGVAGAAVAYSQRSAEGVEGEAGVVGCEAAASDVDAVGIG